MSRHRSIFIYFIYALLFAIVTIGLFLYSRSSPANNHIPIPAATLAAYQPGNPINNSEQAFVAAQFYLGVTRLRAIGEILPYSAESMRLTEAIARTRQPGQDSAANRPGSSIVWLVIFEGQWFIEPPVLDATPTEPQPGYGCVYAILDARDGEGMMAGGIRECSEYQAELFPPQPIWYSPVITIPLPISTIDKIQTGEWLSAARLQVTTQESRSSGLYRIDLGTGEPLVSTLRPSPPTEQAYSAASMYSVQCGNPLQMIDVANQAVISQADLILNPGAVIHCSGYVSWGGDGIAAFAARAEGVWSTYLWRPDGSTPFRVGPALNGAEPPAWSPDGGQFAYLNYTDSVPRILQIFITDLYGRLLQTVPTNLTLPPTEMRWIGGQVLGLRDSSRLWQYYNADSGELLFTWQEALSMGSELDHQYPSPSPNGRWFTIERGGLDSSGILNKTYHVYNLENHQEIPLYDRPWHLLEFSGWSPDGERLYVLHLPAGPDAAADPGLPYGLLAYRLTNGQFELLVENTQEVYWDANYQKALVSVFVRDSAGQSTLTAGIWDGSTNQVAGAALITSAPTQYEFLLHPYSMNRWVPAAWSPDGGQVAFFTWQGDLLLMDLDGQTQLLASQVGLGRSDFTRLLAWAPDGVHLFVSERGSVWIVTIPLLP